MEEKTKAALVALFVNQAPYIDADFDAFSILDLLLNMSTDEIFAVIKSHQSSLIPVVSNNIPQFSTADEIFSVLRVVIDSGIEDLSYEKIGYYLCDKGAKVGAQVKYGENHYKLAAQLGLVTFAKPFTPTDIGLAYYLTESAIKRQAIKKHLALRIPIIQQALLLADESTVNMGEFMRRYLSQSTMLRRRSNVRELLQYIMDVADVPMQHRLNNIVWG